MPWPRTAHPILVPFGLPAEFEARILSGLPYAGTAYHDISPSGRLLIRPGLVAQVTPHGGASWIGNFERGGEEGSYLSGIAHTPVPRIALVMASGQGYFVHTTDPASWRTAAISEANEVILLRDRGWFVFADGTGMSCYTAQGDLRWQGQLVVDDLRVMHVDGDIIRGFGWSGVMEETDGDADLWFEVSAASGFCTYTSTVPIAPWWDYPPGRNIAQ